MNLTAVEQTLNNLALLDPPPQEILIVDGGSQDNTVEIARQAGISVLVATQAGRSLQMNLGAAKAQGDYLCFVHADTFVPSDLNLLIEKTLSDRTIDCGGFDPQLPIMEDADLCIKLVQYGRIYLVDRLVE